MKNNQLSYKNHWEAHVYAVDGKTITQLNLVEIQGTRYPVESFPDSRRYNDHGQTHTVVSADFTIGIDIHGVVIQIPLRTLLKKHVEILAVEYV